MHVIVNQDLVFMPTVNFSITLEIGDWDLVEDRVVQFGFSGNRFTEIPEQDLFFGFAQHGFNEWSASSGWSWTSGGWSWTCGGWSWASSGRSWASSGWSRASRDRSRASSGWSRAGSGLNTWE